ncbi:hypothetical protein ACVR05_07310 [Streptococcus caprae]|uniref:MFS transporter n=1 Tax=Streptococcus caprae TaxID=1640501 RepID=A0ABV8CV74_9STRE
MRDKKDIIFFIAIFFVIVFKIKLLLDSPLALNVNTGFDDLLQIKNSLSIVSGDWLGKEYFFTTMAKNVSYPFFLAISNFFNLPYGFSYGIFISISCLIFLKAIAPIFNSRIKLFFIFIFIMFVPISFDATYRIYRNSLVPWSVLMILSSFIAIYIRREYNIKKLIPWSIIGFFALGFFWYLREDSIWITPFFIVVIPIFFTSYYLRSGQIKKVLIKTLVIVFPLFGIGVFGSLISFKNYQEYGIWAVNDRTATEAPKLMSLIYKIDDGSNTDKDVWASRKSFELAIDASPTLKKYEEIILSSYGLWAGDEADIKGDISYWALRFAFEEDGLYHNNAEKTNEVYKKSYSELQDAFEKGILKKKKGIYLSSQTGAFQLSDFRQTLAMSLPVTKEFLSYTNTSLSENYLNYSSLSNSDLIYFENILNTNLPRTDEQLLNLELPINYENYSLDLASVDNEVVLVNNNIKRSRKNSFQIQNTITSFYIKLSPLLVIVSFLGYLILIFDIFNIKNRFSLEIFLIITGCVLLGFVNIFVVVLFSRWLASEPTSYIFGYYASSSYLLYSLAMLLGMFYFFEVISKLKFFKKFIFSKIS